MSSDEYTAVQKKEQCKNKIFVIRNEISITTTPNAIEHMLR